MQGKWVITTRETFSFSLQKIPTSSVTLYKSLKESCTVININIRWLPMLNMEILQSIKAVHIKLINYQI